MTWMHFTAVLYGLTATLATLALLDTSPTQRRAILRRLNDAPGTGGARRDPRARWAQVMRAAEQMLQRIGQRRSKQQGAANLDELLLQAGYRHPHRVAILRGSRFVAALAVGSLVLLGLLLAGGSLAQSVPLAGYSSTLGLLIPRWYLVRRRRARQAELQRVLPDVLDLLVVCVDSGLGLNQALVRVAEEIQPISTAMSDELARTNAEIRAGVARDDALRHLAQRNAVEDLRTLVQVLIQTSRFGTPVAQALRQQSGALRRRQQQRMEEEGGKIAVRLLFPMVLFIFPPLVIVVLGPAVLQLAGAMTGMK